MWHITQTPLPTPHASRAFPNPLFPNPLFPEVGGQVWVAGVQVGGQVGGQTRGHVEALGKKDM